ncbi:MAG: FAD-dependent oxidoreductase [Syntrophobacterales bacterium]|jgi:alkyl hydroperoxide reductase subunit F|nr:FAD-dependent oxidoreductase [Syntrophobacterales bacterium]
MTNEEKSGLKTDPVCRMEVREEDAVTADCDGITYYFCSEGCRDKFLKERTCARTAYDLIIIGGGPAGLTAAVYACTSKVEALLVAKDLGGQAVDSTKIENYLGFDFITGPELIDKFRHHLFASHYIDHLMIEVEGIEPHEGGFKVTTAELAIYTAKALIIATGMTRRRLGVPGEEKFLRKGIFYGAIQELSFVEGEDTAVIGGGNSALQMVDNLHTVARNIHLISTSELTADAAVVERVACLANLHTYIGYKVLEFTGDRTLAGISIRKKAGAETLSLPVKGAFIAVGLEPNSSLVAPLVQRNQRREIVIHTDCSTSCRGIFAAGDVTDAFGKRIVIASGEGAKAALAARQYLLNLRKAVCPPP